MSQINVTVVPGYTWQDGELWTAEKANLAANPTITAIDPNGASGGGGSGAVVLADLASGMFTANLAGIAPFAAGWLYTAANGAGGLSLFGTGMFSADAYGRAPFANGWLTVTLVANGTFTADTPGRAPFAPGHVKGSMVQPDAYWYGVATGTGTATTPYVVTFSPDLAAYTNPSLTSYPDGMVISVKIPVACGAAPQLQANSVAGARTIYRMDGSAIIAGDLGTNQIYELRFNSTLNGWQMMTAPVNLLPFYRAGTFQTSAATAKAVTFSSATPGNTTNFALVVTQVGTNYGTSYSITNVSATGFTLTNVGATNTATWNYIVLPLN